MPLVTCHCDITALVDFLTQLPGGNKKAPKRRHSTLGYLSPMEFEKQMILA